MHHHGATLVVFQVMHGDSRTSELI